MAYLYGLVLWINVMIHVVGSYTQLRAGVVALGFAAGSAVWVFLALVVALTLVIAVLSRVLSWAISTILARQRT